nr:MAG TPA: hypothetical protein [Caudoviricetes sp.]
MLYYPHSFLHPFLPHRNSLVLIIVAWRCDNN